VARKPAKRPAAKKSSKPAVKKPAAPSGEPSLRWTKSQLEAAAYDLNLDLSSDSTKAAILAAIEESRRTSETAAIPRGDRLYAALVTATSPDAVKVMAEEAGRIADRLDELDKIIAGKGVLRLMQFRLHDSFDSDGDRHCTVKVSFDNVLAEARQQASALRQILVALGVEKASQAPPASGGTPLDEFTRKLAEREATRQARA